MARTRKVAERASDRIRIGRSRWQVVCYRRTPMGTFMIVKTAIARSWESAIRMRNAWEKPWFDYATGRNGAGR